jgi:hypothetical protein
MIYKKLEGTTSRSFQIAKNGIEFSLLNEGLHIYTPKTNAVFELGVDEIETIFNDGSYQVQNGLDIPNAHAVVDYINQTVLDLNFDGVQEALNSLGEIIQAIGNDQSFFTNLITKVLGDDYYVDNANPDGFPDLATPTNIADFTDIGETDVNGDPAVKIPAGEATISRRLSILEGHKGGKRLSALQNVTSSLGKQRLDTTAGVTNLQRDNHLLYVYEKTDNGEFIHKKISLKELRTLRPGVYTGSGNDLNNVELEKQDYFFEEITEGE